VAGAKGEEADEAEFALQGLAFVLREIGWAVD
jgi:hypothetical protein